MKKAFININKLFDSKYTWLIIAIAISIIFTNPAYGLIIGVVLSVITKNPQIKFTSTLAKSLLKLSVVILGFGLNISTVISVGISSIHITVIGISATMILGYLLGKLFSIDSNIRILLSSGTAICGGSAIAAIAPAINASSSQIAVSMAIIFLLNAVGLIIFPPIGNLLNLSQQDFGLWAALAIHDTSSVVGAATTYGAVALVVATTVKLTRTLWIIPLSFTIAKINKSESKTVFPFFLVGFIITATIRTIFPSFEVLFNHFAVVGKEMMSGILFLIGAGLTVSELKKIGAKPLIVAVILWIIVSVATLLAIYYNLFTVDFSTQ